MSILYLLTSLLGPVCIYILCTDRAKERLENDFRIYVIMLLIGTTIALLFGAWFFYRFPS